MKDINEKLKNENNMASFVSRFILAGLFFWMFAGLSGCALVHHYDAITGKVVDVDTGEPLDGAAVHASYYTTFYNMVDPTSWYLNSQEVLTGKNGEFRIPSQLSFAFRPMNLFDDDVNFVIFKPGYSCFRNSMKPVNKELEGANDSSQKNLVELSRLKTIDDRRLSTYCTPADGNSSKDYPLLLELLNKECSTIGIQKY